MTSAIVRWILKINMRMIFFKSPKARDTINIPLYLPYASNWQHSDLDLSLLSLEIRHGHQHEPAA